HDHRSSYDWPLTWDEAGRDARYGQVGKQHGPWMSHYSVFFVSISFFIVTAATVGYFIFYSARRLNSLRQQNRTQ
ncbi:hypothetical protein M9458_011996, partial [Cirrhinus mrigala]